MGVQQLFQCGLVVECGNEPHRTVPHGCLGSARMVTGKRTDRLPRPVAGDHAAVSYAGGVNLKRLLWRKNSSGFS